MIDLKDKYVFWDFDGTLTAYGLDTGETFYNELSIEENEKFLFSDIYKNKKPIKEIQDISNNLPADKQFLCGALIYGREITDKINFLKKYYKNIKEENCYFLSHHESKAEIILTFCYHFKISPEDVILIDDRHETLRECWKKGIKAYHPTVLLK